MPFIGIKYILGKPGTYFNILMPGSFMSVIGGIFKAIGLHDRFRTRLLDSVLMPYITTGQIALNEARFLGEIARTLGSGGPIIEIGTLFGSSTMVIAENKSEGRKLITVDSFCWNPCGLTGEQHERIARARLADAIQNHDTTLIRMDKDEFQRGYAGDPPAMVFIDADHSFRATKSDIDWALSRKADLICGHDYSDNTPGVMEAVDKSGGVEKLVGSLWVLRSQRPPVVD
jgi:hypothetical protein